MRKLLTVALVCATSLSPIMTTAANAYATQTPVADPASQDTLDEMQNQCDAMAAAHDTGNGDVWTGVVVPGAVTLVSGPTEVPGTRDIDLDSIVGIGDPHPSEVYFPDAPYRTGGSVNLFGDQFASAAWYDDSTYNYTADFDSTFAHAFSCEIYQEVYHPEQTIHHPAVGEYVIAGDFGESEDAIRGNCAAFTAQGSHTPPPSWWGEPFRGGSSSNPHCMFVGDPAWDEVIDEFWEDPVLRFVEAGSVDQDQTDNLEGFEPNGGPFEISGEVFIGKVVVCISPANPSGGKKGVPGEWKNHNGYEGDDCNTDYFNNAPWGEGSQTSNGTYISVPPAI